MLKSMTGFAYKSITINLDDKNKLNFSISLKSLNSRYFEAICKLPYFLSQLETELIKLLKTKLKRGTVYLTIHISDQNFFKTSLKPDLKIIKDYLNSSKEIKNTFKLKGEISLDNLIQLPNVFTTEERLLDEKTKKILIKNIENLIEVLIEERKGEGKLLEKDIKKRIFLTDKDISDIEKKSKKMITKQKAKISKNLSELNKDSVEDLTELNNIYSYLDKIDIHEEIVRFKSHIENLKKIIAVKEVEKGKKIDFTLQELTREINTISAKCSDAEISTKAINIKVELEKIREQVQNIV